MSGLIGDRTGKNTLEEMMKVSEERNREVAEEERLEALRKKEEEKSGKAPSMTATEASPVIIEPSMEDIVDFYGTPLCRNDYDAINRIYKEMGKDLRAAYFGGNCVAISSRRIRQFGALNYDLEEVPDCIKELGALLRVCMKNNKFEHLPDSIGELHVLEELDVGYNRLRTLPLSIENLKKLKYLHVPGNGMLTLPFAVERLPLLFVDAKDNPSLDGISKQMLERMKARGVDVRY